MSSNICLSGCGKYLNRGGKPFFWLADTAWLIFYKLNEEQISLYLRNRKEKGFNAILSVMIHETGGFGEFNSDGSLCPSKSGYWDAIERTVALAEEMGLQMGLLPAWGSLVEKGILNEGNIEEYSRFIGEKFQRFDNIVWFLGGDIRAEGHESLYRREAALLKEYNPDRLITYHPFGRTSSSQWFHEEPWLDFNSFQSGHRRYDQQQLGEWDDALSPGDFKGEDSWRYVREDLALNSPKPVIDMEPSYEGIPQGLHNPRNPYWEEWDVRRYAYWSVFQGAAGHTYGSNAVMQFHDDMSSPGAYGVREVWKDALHHPGSGQMKHLKDLMLSVDYQSGAPRDDLLLYGQKERYHRISVFGGEDFLFCYDYLGDEFMLDLRNFGKKEWESWWMNPADGTRSYAGPVGDREKLLVSPVRRKGIANDWVFILRSPGE